MTDEDVLAGSLAVLAHCCLYVGAAWVTRHRLITLFHLALAVQFFAFVARPCLTIITDGLTLYPTNPGWQFYEKGLWLQLVFVSLYVGGYLLLEVRTKKKVVEDRFLLERSAPAILWSFLLGTAAVGLIILLSGRAWLPSEREQTLTSVVPFGKVLFPLAVITLSTSIPL